MQRGAGGCALNKGCVMITIIDYGAGNLANVTNALNHLGIGSEIVTEPERIYSAEKIILPGVGAFAPAMERLKTSGLAEPVSEKARAGTPLLGICLGMQLLFTESEEGGLCRGLDLVPGRVVRFEGAMKIPHMGWNSLEFSRDVSLNSEIVSGKYAFFVHSYHCVPKNDDFIIAKTEYGTRFVSIVGRDSIFGVQFHPEKSQQTGLALLKNFCSL